MTQCLGKTQKGERCKRESREGSAYCAIHIEQEGRQRPERSDAAPWTTDDMVKAGIGFGILAAIVLLRIRR
jgi:hypothetical protein